MSKKKKALALAVVLVIVTAVVVVVMTCEGRRGLGRQTALKIIPDNVDLQIKNFHFTEVGDADWKWEINADTAKYLKKQNIAHFDRIRINILRADGEKIVITGKKGLLHTDTKDMTIEGEVRVALGEDGLVETDHLEYLNEEKKIRTNDPVVFTNSRLRIKGMGMTFDIPEKKITLLQNVRATYER